MGYSQTPKKNPPQVFGYDITTLRGLKGTNTIIDCFNVFRKAHFELISSKKQTISDDLIAYNAIIFMHTGAKSVLD